MAPAGTHLANVLAELFGTMLLALTTNVLMSSEKVDLLTKAVGMGAAYTTLVGTTGSLLNPAATLTAACTGRLAAHVALVLAIVQITGAALAGVLQVLLVPGVHFGHQGPGCLINAANGTMVHVGGWETILTALLVASYSAEYAPLAVGASQLLATLTGARSPLIRPTFTVLPCSRPYYCSSA